MTAAAEAVVRSLILLSLLLLLILQIATLVVDIGGIGTSAAVVVIHAAADAATTDTTHTSERSNEEENDSGSESRISVNSSYNDKNQDNNNNNINGAMDGRSATISVAELRLFDQLERTKDLAQFCANIGCWVEEHEEGDDDEEDDSSYTYYTWRMPPPSSSATNNMPTWDNTFQYFYKAYYETARSTKSNITTTVRNGQSMTRERYYNIPSFRPNVEANIRPNVGRSIFALDVIPKGTWIHRTTHLHSFTSMNHYAAFLKYLYLVERRRQQQQQQDDNASSSSSSTVFEPRLVCDAILWSYPCRIPQRGLKDEEHVHDHPWMTKDPAICIDFDIGSLFNAGDEYVQSNVDEIRAPNPLPEPYNEQHFDSDNNKKNDNGDDDDNLSVFHLSEVSARNIVLAFKAKQDIQVGEELRIEYTFSGQTRGVWERLGINYREPWDYSDDTNSGYEESNDSEYYDGEDEEEEEEYEEEEWRRHRSRSYREDEL